MWVIPGGTSRKWQFSSAPELFAAVTKVYSLETLSGLAKLTTSIATPPFFNLLPTSSYSGSVPFNGWPTNNIILCLYALFILCFKAS